MAISEKINKHSNNLLIKILGACLRIGLDTDLHGFLPRKEKPTPGLKIRKVRLIIIINTCYLINYIILF